MLKFTRLLPRTRLIIVICTLTLALSSVFVFTQGASSDSGTEALKDQATLQILMGLIKEEHYSPKPIDDKFSKDLFALYLKRLDPNKRFFIKSDIDQLSHYDTKIDDELGQGDLTFFKEATDRLQFRVANVKTLVNDILVGPIDLSVSENIQLDPKKLNYCDDENALKIRWQKVIKFQILTTYMDLYENRFLKKNTLAKGKLPQKIAPPATSQPIKLLPDLLAEARTSVEKGIKRQFELFNDSNRDRASQFFDVIANTFDPHTSCLAPEVKEDFDIDISGTLEGIGAVLQDDNGMIKVSSIVPGSASWRQKGLNPGDFILKVGQADGEAVDISGMKLKDVVRLIRGKKGTEVRLTVKKPDSQIITLPIIRDVVVIEDTYVKSALVTQSKTGEMIGYIHLPSFYHDFRANTGRNAYQDMHDALINLKSKPIKGLILDLRDNSGGALEDAVKASGLFIKTGPIVQVQSRKKSSTVLSDYNPEIAYDGPLVVLINGLSASASEILAAALQDYGRAVIIGSSASFGKGTVQTFVNLDDLLSQPYTKLKPLGSLKLTIQKFYRINGGSTQYKGVVPDILLPDIYTYSNLGEKTLLYSLPWDTIDPAQSYNPQSHVRDIEQLRQNSAQRLTQSPRMSEFKSYIAKFKFQQTQTEHALALDNAWEQRRKLKTQVEEFKAIQPSNAHIRVSLITGASTKDPQRLKQIKEKNELLRKDFYINEAFYILNDMLTQKNWARSI